MSEAQRPELLPDISEGSTVILAKDLHEGMLWTGDMPIQVLKVEEGPVQNCFPWDMGREAVRKADPVPMQMVVVHGLQTLPDLTKPYHGKWTIQPDTPIEVRDD